MSTFQIRIIPPKMLIVEISIQLIAYHIKKMTSLKRIKKVGKEIILQGRRFYQ